MFGYGNNIYEPRYTSAATRDELTGKYKFFYVQSFVKKGQCYLDYEILNDIELINASIAILVLAKY